MDNVSTVRERTDIVQLIGSFITLKKMGGNFKAPCPFHQEKTPSFVVSPERQIWHCFGCQKGGDVFTFIMEYEHVEFPEALKILADRAGITLQNNFDSKNASKRELLLEINRLAGEYYHFLLTKHAVGEKAREYLKKRGINEKLWETFQIGFAPKGANLYQYLTQKKHLHPQDIADAGLSAGMRKNMDFFQNRLTFALCDHRGNILGFSGRAIDTDFFGGKYINTRETDIYHKGEACFGLNITKDEIKKKNQVMVMEGEFDVMSSFQEGVGNVIALKGTAFTKMQAKLLKRFCNKVTLCLDMDSAGQDALRRSVPVLEEEDMTITAVVLPSGKDPDELAREDPIALRKALEDDSPIYDVLLQQFMHLFDGKTIEGKKQISSQFLSYLTTVQNEVVKDHYLKLLGKSLDVSVEVLMREFEKAQRVQSLGKDTPMVVSEEKKSRQDMLEEYTLAILVQQSQPQMIIRAQQELFSRLSWHIPSRGKLIQSLLSLTDYQPAQFASTLASELVPVFDMAFLQPIASFTQDEAEKECVKSVKELISLSLRQQMKEVSEEIQVQEKANNEEKIAQLEEQLSKIMQEIAHIEKP